MLARPPPAFLPKPNAPVRQQPGYAHRVRGVAQDMPHRTDAGANSECTDDAQVVDAPHNGQHPDGRPVRNRAVRYERTCSQPILEERHFGPVRHGGGEPCQNCRRDFRNLSHAAGARDSRCHKCGAKAGPPVSTSCHGRNRKGGATAPTCSIGVAKTAENDILNP